MKDITIRTLIILGLFIFIISGCSREHKYFEGYVDSKLRYISSNFSGQLEKLYVIEGTKVTKGQPLFVLEQYPQKWDIDQAIARIATATAQINAFTIKSDAAEKKYKRRQELKLTNYAAQEELDTTQSDLAIAEEALKKAKSDLDLYKAQLSESQWSLGKKSVFSKENGIVYDVFFYQDEIVPAEKPVLSLLVPEDIKIIFFVPEKEISKLAIGQKIKATCDGCTAPIYAKISFISSKTEFTPPVIFSEDMRDKLVFEVEARTDLKTSERLHPGQPLSVTIENQ